MKQAVILDQVLDSPRAVVSKTELALVSNAAPKLSFFERLPFFGQAVIGLNRRGFEGRLGKLINSALAHEQEGLSPGSDEYKRLARMADESISSYCLSRNVDRLDLESQIPAMNKLRNLASPKPVGPPSWSKPSFLLPVALVSAFAFLVMGVNCGLFEAAKHLTEHLLIR